MTPAIVSLVAVSLACGFFAVRPTARPPRTGLVAEPAVVAFGRLGQGEMVQADYLLTNHGPEPVDIDGVQPSCDCESPSVTRDHLDPGETAQVRVGWRIGSKRGQVADPLWVRYKRGGGSVRRLELALTADIEPDIRCEPMRVEFPTDRPGVADLQLFPGRQAAFVIKHVSANHPSLQAAVQPATTVVEVRFTPRSDLQYGPMFGVTVETDSVHEPRLFVPVRFVPKPE